MNTLSYIKTVDGNKNIQDLKEKLFRAAPDLEHAIITDASTIEAQAATIERLADALEECVFIMEKAGLEPESYGDLITKAARALLAELFWKEL